MFWIKNFAGNDKTIVEIVESDAQYGLLKMCNIDHVKVCLPLDLCVGELKNMANYDRIELKKYIIGDDYSPFKEGYRFEHEMDELKKYIEKAEKIRIWSSHLDCDDYCLLLYICHSFPCKKISVLFSEEYNWHCVSTSMMSEKEVPQLLEKEHLLTKNEIEEYNREWEEIVTKNAELRFMINGKVVSASIEYFDNDILSRLENLGEVNIYTLVANLMGNPIIHNVYYSDYIYLYLINRLIENKLIDKRIVDGKTFVKIANFTY